jgi:hypothetical protein
MWATMGASNSFEQKRVSTQAQAENVWYGLVLTQVSSLNTYMVCLKGLVDKILEDAFIIVSWPFTTETLNFTVSGSVDVTLLTV